MQSGEDVVAYLIGARGGFGYGDYRADGDVHDEAWICLAPFRMGRPRCDPVVGMVMECRRGCAGAVVARGRGGAVGLGGTCGVDDFPAWDVDLLATSPHRHVDELLHHHADTESGRRNGNLSCSAWSSGRGRDRCIGAGGTAQTSVVSLLGSLGSQYGVCRRCRPGRAP